LFDFFKFKIKLSASAVDIEDHRLIHVDADDDGSCRDADGGTSS
jgi:hypothetical protein